MLLRHASLALAAGLALGVPAASAATDTPVAAEHVTVPTQPSASPQDSATYAQRQAQDHKVADYQGGASVLIVGSSGAILVVLILLLILV